MKKNKICEYDIDYGKVFEFNGIECIEDFELISDIIKNDLKVILVENLDGPTANIHIFEENSIKFKLINNINFGNALMLLEEKEDNYLFLRDLAEKVYDIYAKKYPENIT